MTKEIACWELRRRVCALTSPGLKFQVKILTLVAAFPERPVCIKGLSVGVYLGSESQEGLESQISPWVICAIIVALDILCLPLYRRDGMNKDLYLVFESFNHLLEC